MYAESSVKKYLNDLAARKPTPGGGSAAALEAGLGCALISMVANYTVTNKKYKDVKSKAAESLKRSEDLRRTALEVVDEDVNAYGRLSDGFKRFGKDSPELENMYKDACGAVFKICNIANEALNLLRELVEYANTNLITDAAIAALMLESAFFGAKFNVYINLKYINDKDYIEEVHKTLLSFESTIPKLKEEILHTCENVIMR